MKKLLNRFLIRLNNYLKYLDEQQYYAQLRSQFVGNGAIVHLSARIFNSSKEQSNIQIGDKSVIDGELIVYPYGGQINIGDNTYIGMGTRVWSCDKVEIGKNVLIAHNVNIIDNDTHPLDADQRINDLKNIIKYGSKQEQGNVKSAPIIIEDNVWISFNATILKGVRIGKGAIIGAGSVITKDVSPYTVMIGNPAKSTKKLQSYEK